MKTIWVWGLLSLFPIVAYTGIPVALSGARQPPSEARTSPFAAPPPSLEAPVGAIAREAPSGGPQNPHRSTAMPAPGSTNNDDTAAARLAEYVFLHKTRNESIPFHVVASMKVCPE